MNKYLRFFIRGMLILLIVVFFMNMLGVFSDNVETYPALLDTLSYEYETEGYLFFNETLIASPFDATLKILVNDGQRVKGRQPIVELFATQIEEEEEPETQLIDTKSIMVDKEMIQKRIKSLEDEVSYYISEKRISEAEDLKVELSYLYTVSAQLPQDDALYRNEPVSILSSEVPIINNIGFQGGAFSSESEEQEEQNNPSFNDSNPVLVSPHGGIIGLHLSEMDPLFDMRNSYIMNFNELPEMLETKNEVKRTVKQGEPFLKIIDNHVIFVVISVPQETLDYFLNKGRFTSIIDDVEMETSVEEVFFQENGYGLKLRIHGDFNDMQNKRKVSVKTIPLSNKGLIVHNKSMIEQDGQMGVMVKRKNQKIEFVPIKILNTVGERSVVEKDNFGVLDDDGVITTVQTISIYDDILEKPENE